MNKPLDRLKHHVTNAIERGEKTAIVAVVPTKYNGWANYETWNVALWIGNDEGLHNMAKGYRNSGYRTFVCALLDLADPKDDTIHQLAFETPDNVAWNDPDLDIDALDEMIREL